MKVNKDSTSYIIKVAALLSLAGASVVSIAAVGLKPIQDANAAKEKKKNILIAAGIYDSTKSIEGTFDANIIAEAINLKTGERTDAIDVATFNSVKAAKDPRTGRVLANDPAKIGGVIANNAVVYQLKKGDKLERVILPIRGYGLWGTMYGFLAMNKDGKTVEGITFYELKETPGLGAEVTNPEWQAKWVGKKPFKDGVPHIQLVKDVSTNADVAQHQVDSLAGATLTSRGVQYTINFWLGDEGYGPYLKKLAQ